MCKYIRKRMTGRIFPNARRHAVRKRREESDREDAHRSGHPLLLVPATTIPSTSSSLLYWKIICEWVDIRVTLTSIEFLLLSVSNICQERAFRLKTITKQPLAYDGSGANELEL